MKIGKIGLDCRSGELLGKCKNLDADFKTFPDHMVNFINNNDFLLRSQTTKMSTINMKYHLKPSNLMTF